MPVPRGAIGIGALLLCGAAFPSAAGIGTAQPLTAVDLQSADAPPTGTGVDLTLADDWGAVDVDPNLVISVEPVEGGADEACWVVWRDGQARVRGSVRQTRERLGLEPVR